MQAINAWLQSDRDYKTGLALYAKYGQSSFLKTIFAQGPTPYNLLKLEAELESIAPAPPAVKVESLKLKAENEKIDTSDAPKVDTSKNHRIYLELQEEQKNKYRQLQRNMVELDLQTNENILHQTAKQILHLHKKITDNWKTLDHYDEHGVFPFQKEKPIPKTPAIQLLHESLSKAKRRLKSGKCRDIAQTTNLIAEQTAKLKALQNKTEWVQSQV